MSDLEQAKLLLRIADSPDPKRRCAELAADCIIAAHEQNPALTLAAIRRTLMHGEVWHGHDEAWLEGLINWRRHELALQNNHEPPTFVSIADGQDAA
jgi:hypothetical protein